MTTPTKVIPAVLLSVFLGGISTASLPSDQDSRVSGLLPKPDGWTEFEPLQTYIPDTLFEYINGAAENFISYGFVELAVGQYRGADGKAEMTVEVYDMGRPDNAFGIYGSERYPESRFLPIGVQGYIEDGVLNFFGGRFYVKLMAYEAGDKTETVLKQFAAAVLKGIPETGDFPLPIRSFPAAGLVKNSEKFILRDFLGMAFLTRGYVATYRTGETGEYDAFIIDTPLPEEALKTWTALIGHFSKSAATAAPASGEIARLKDPYLANLLVLKEGRFVVGAVKVKDGAEAAAEKTLRAAAASLAGK